MACVDDTMLDTLTREYPQFRHKMWFAPNGVAQELLDLGSRRLQRFNFSRRPLRVLAVGSLIRRKRFEDILEAIQSSKHLLDGIELRLVGAGPLKDAIRRRITDLGIQGVSILGAVKSQHMLNQYEWADVLVLPSESEGRPNVVIEAMACGCTVAGSDVAGIQSLVEDGITGRLFEPGDIDGLAICIESLLEPTVRLELARQAYDRVQRIHGTWDQAARRYHDAFIDMT